ncbi:VOC family protein [Vibrio sp.]|uniref:VOC family protein n=1 Tax=Vibrio sp. TaxID=678 RepID=UPI003D0DFCA3
MHTSLENTGLAPAEMLGSVNEFISKITELTQLIGLDLSAFQADHIALRINDVEVAQLAHQAWLSYGQQISATQINGRPIIVIKFDQPLRASSWQIECLELPYPAAGKPYPRQGWEHVEFVIPSDAQSADGYLADVQQRFSGLKEVWPKLTQLGVKSKLSSPQGEGERLANPTIAFKYQGVCIKLHPHALSTIIASEQ